MTEKTRQEEAYEYVSSTFVKLLENDDRIAYEHKRSVIAFWEDLFAHEGVRNNIVQAFSNLLFEIDDKVDAARKAGIQQVRDVYTQEIDKLKKMFGDEYTGTTDMFVVRIIDGLLEVESTPEEPTIKAEDLENMDLSEVGGGDEDDTSPL